MNIISKLTRKNLLLNKKRTLVTIIGIMLATALITAVADAAVSAQASMVEYEKKESGNFHYTFSDVSSENFKYFQENRYVQQAGRSATLGYAYLPGAKNEDRPYLYLLMADKKGFDSMSMELVEGRLPENDGEIVIPQAVWTNGGVKYEIGDTISLDIGHRVPTEEATYTPEEHMTQFWDYSYDAEELAIEDHATYTVVGIMKQPIHAIEPYGAAGYTTIVGWNPDTAPDKQTVYASYTGKGIRIREEVTAGLLNVPLELYKKWENGEPLTDEEWMQMQAVASDVESNIWLIKWELLDFSSGAMTMLYSMAGIAIVVIIISSVFCIRNSFVISLTEKMKLYGMLSSVGTTKRQRRKLVYQEALILGSIGIPLGIVLGIAAIYITIHLTSGLAARGLGVPFVFKLSWLAILVSIVVSLITILLSAGQSAYKASKISPMNAIRGNETIRQKKQNLKCPKIIKSCFGMGGQIAYKNLKRARVKYRTTVISIVVSVAIFVGMGSLLRIGLETEEMYYGNIDYQIRVNMMKTTSMDEAKKIAALDGVTFAEISRTGYCSIKSDELKLTNDYKKYFYLSGSLDDMSKDVTMSDIYSEEEDVYIPFILVVLDSVSFADYCKELGIMNPTGKVILADNFYMEAWDIQEKKSTKVSGMLYEIKAGDTLRGTMTNYYGSDESEPLNCEFKIDAVVDKKPLCIDFYTSEAAIVVDEEYFAGVYGPSFDENEYLYDQVATHLRCDDPDTMENTINELLIGKGDYDIYNINREYENSKSLFALFAVFLYGFIIVIALIGITNIFNTVTTNMELRTREFAMLKSIGMTSKEFRKMVCLESVFYGGKALMIGIPAGIIISVLFHMAAVGGSLEFPYHFPYESILISIVAVAILLIIIMWYSMNKINRKNIIDAIQIENI